MPPKLPPHVVQVRNKVGRPYLYLMKYRGTPRAEKAIRLPDDPRQPEFLDRICAAHARAHRARKSNTVAKLIEAWHASPEWKQMKPKTRVDWGAILPAHQGFVGAYEVKGIEPKNVLTLRDLYASTPASANNLLRCLSRCWLGPFLADGGRITHAVRSSPKGRWLCPWPWDTIEEARQTLRDLWWVVGFPLMASAEEDVLSMKRHPGQRSRPAGKTDQTLWIP